MSQEERSDPQYAGSACQILWLRASYWLGAVADAFVGVRMLMPDAMGEAGFRYAMGTSSALAFGWTVLLVWADRQPMQRKGILLITIFPVISGLLASGFYASWAGIFSVGRLVPFWVLGAFLIGVMGFSYYNARDAGHNSAGTSQASE